MSDYLYYIGHSTTFLSLAGQTFLTDPLILPGAGPLKRKKPLPPLPDFDETTPTVLLSHGHKDHLHLPSLRELSKSLSLYAPEGVALRLQKKGFKGAERVSPGDSFSLGDVSVEVVLAEHSVEAVGFIISSEGGRVYFAGDTDLFPEMSDIEDVDVALLPISGWGRTLGEGHLNPERAAKAVEIIRPKTVVPIHWGTLMPFGMPRNWAVDQKADKEFFRALYKLDLDSSLKILEPGEFLFFN